MKQIKLCPICKQQNRPDAWDCANCSTPLDGVDPIHCDDSDLPQETHADLPSFSLMSPAPNSEMLSRPAICPNPDCAAPLLQDSERCSYCGTPIIQNGRLSSKTIVKITWPWGCEPLSAPITVGREAPTPPSLLEKLEAAYGNISRRHAILDPKNGHLVVRDLGSSNGTFHNDCKIPVNTDIPIANGDRIRFAANLEIIVHYVTK